MSLSCEGRRARPSERPSPAVAPPYRARPPCRLRRLASRACSEGVDAVPTLARAPCSLVAVAFKQVTAAYRPPVPYLTLLDWYILLVVWFLAACLLMHAIEGHLTDDCDSTSGVVRQTGAWTRDYSSYSNRDQQMRPRSPAHSTCPPPTALSGGLLMWTVHLPRRRRRFWDGRDGAARSRLLLCRPRPLCHWQHRLHNRGPPLGALREPLPPQASAHGHVARPRRRALLFPWLASATWPSAAPPLVSWARSPRSTFPPRSTLPPRSTPPKPLLRCTARVAGTLDPSPSAPYPPSRRCARMSHRRRPARSGSVRPALCAAVPRGGCKALRPPRKRRTQQQQESTPQAAMPRRTHGARWGGESMGQRWPTRSWSRDSRAAF